MRPLLEIANKSWPCEGTGRKLMRTFYSRENTLFQIGEMEVFEVKWEHFQVRNSHLIIPYRWVYKGSVIPLLKCKPPSPHRPGWGSGLLLHAQCVIPPLWISRAKKEWAQGEHEHTNASLNGMRFLVSLLLATSCHFCTSELSGYFSCGEGGQ